MTSHVTRATAMLVAACLTLFAVMIPARADNADDKSKIDATVADVTDPA